MFFSFSSVLLYICISPFFFFLFVCLASVRFTRGLRRILFFVPRRFVKGRRRKTTERETLKNAFVVWFIPPISFRVLRADTCFDERLAKWYPEEERSSMSREKQIWLKSLKSATRKNELSHPFYLFLIFFSFLTIFFDSIYYYFFPPSRLIFYLYLLVSWWFLCARFLGKETTVLVDFLVNDLNELSEDCTKRRGYPLSVF